MSTSLSSTLQSRISQIIEQKKSNVIVSLDFTDFNVIVNFIHCIGPHTLGVKLHSDIVSNFDQSVLLSLKEKYNIIVIEDRKFCDIGNTVNLQSQTITEYADLITVHSIPGESIMEGLKDNCLKNGCGILLIAQMSTDQNLINTNYTERTVDLAVKYDDIVVGFICQQHLLDGKFHFGVGVSLTQKSDNLGQRYNTPRYLVEQRGIDILIVGRSICNSADPQHEVKKYSFLPNRSEAEMQTQREVVSDITEANRNQPAPELLSQFITCDIVKYGTFTLKSGEISSVYYDFRLLISHPSLLYQVALGMKNMIETSYTFRNRGALHNAKTITFVLDTMIVGVPLGALPLATLVSNIMGMPMIMIRKEQKAYGNQQLIEGLVNRPKCIVIEDVITTGGSVLETIEKLEGKNIKVDHIVAILDREKGGVEMLREKGYFVSTLFKASDIN